ncbi:MAG: hypothetical protein IT367_01200 [Candidatus Hydrogenedentes bacterium]|nr:hypothetical protein [Candidatus Hydrogenedentota bacterium]
MQSMQTLARVTALVAASILFSQCGTITKEVPKAIDLTTLESVREMGGGVAGPWTPLEGGVTNMVPEGVEIAEGQVRDGTGTSIGLLKGFSARDVAMEANVNYAGKGAPALIFRVQEQDNEISAMYAAALFENGVNVWRFSEGNWMLLMTHAMHIAPRTTHTLRVEAKGANIQVYADGEPASLVRDEGLTEGGRAGIRAVEGPCKFAGLRVHKR